MRSFVDASTSMRSLGQTPAKHASWRDSVERKSESFLPKGVAMFGTRNLVAAQRTVGNQALSMVLSRQQASVSSGWRERVAHLREFAPGSPPHNRASLALIRDALGTPNVHMSAAAPWMPYPQLNFSTTSGASGSCVNAQTGATNPLPPTSDYAIVFGSSCLVEEGPFHVVRTLEHEQTHLVHFQTTDNLFRQWQAAGAARTFEQWLLDLERRGALTRTIRRIALERRQPASSGVFVPPETSEVAARITTFADRYAYEPLSAPDALLFHQLQLAAELWHVLDRRSSVELLRPLSNHHWDRSRLERLGRFVVPRQNLSSAGRFFRLFAEAVGLPTAPQTRTRSSSRTSR